MPMNFNQSLPISSSSQIFNTVINESSIIYKNPISSFNQSPFVQNQSFLPNQDFNQNPSFNLFNQFQVFDPFKNINRDKTFNN